MPDDALHFAMEWLDAFRHEHRTKELADMAVALQLNAGDKDAAQAVAWAQFAARPGAAAFYELMAVAEQLGRKRELEKQALWKFEELMRAAEAAPESPNIWQAGPRSELLAIAIREGQSDREWELYAGGRTTKTVSGRGAQRWLGLHRPQAWGRPSCTEWRAGAGAACFAICSWATFGSPVFLVASPVRCPCAARPQP